MTDPKALAASIYAGSDGAADRAAAERAAEFHNGVFFGPVFKGEYPEGFLSALGHRMPAIEPGDLETISQPLDWWGLNYYTPMRVSADPAEGAEFPATVPPPPAVDIRTDIGWEVCAPALGDLVRKLNADYRLPDCYITENGACYNMGVEDGAVDDQPRLDYIADHLGVTAELIAEGYAMRGYFAWSLMDNFEWAEGYGMRFGIVHVDYGTQKRTVKKSGHWYAELAGHFPKGNRRTA